MKFKNLITVLALLVFSTPAAFATKLPEPLKAFIVKQIPGANVRFDGLISLSDGTIYLPVIPAYTENTDKLSVTYTYPANLPLNKKPEVIIFNNNYSLLKLIKTQKGTLTVCQNQDIPMVIKTGYIPQDILVPKGLTLPDTLKGVLGNVQVPLYSAKIVAKAKAKPQTKSKTAPLPNNKNYTSEKVAVNYKLKNKLYYITNYDSSYLKVFSSEQADPLYSLKINGVPKDIKPVENGRYILLTTIGQTNIDVVDVKLEQIAKQIELNVQPSEIVLDKNASKAYVASTPGKAIFIIDLKTMTIKEKIKIVGSPEKIAISDDGIQIAYVDKDTCDIYIINLDDSYENKLITNAPNVSKTLLNDNKLYLAIRTDKKLKVVSYNLNKSFEEEKSKSITNTDNADILGDLMSGFSLKNKTEPQLTKAPKTFSTEEKDFEIGIKPTDMLLYNSKLFILCAQSNDLYVFDTTSQSIKKVIKLPISGFSKKITQVNNTNLALITNVLEKRYVAIDLDKEDAIQTLGINTPVNSITIVDRK